jgi:hypothetical protein
MKFNLARIETGPLQASRTATAAHVRSSVAPEKPRARWPQPEAAIRISPRAPFVLPASGHQTIGCDAGTVWITCGDGEDYVLTAGQRLALAPADEVIVISAMFAPALVRRIGGAFAR